MNKNIGIILILLLLTIEVYAGSLSTGKTSPYYNLLDKRPHRVQNPYRRSGIFSLTEANLAFGLGDTEKPYSDRFFGINTMLGYQYNSTIFAGLGAGMSDFTAGQMLPAFLTARYYFNNVSYTPFFAVDAGLLFHVWGEEVNRRPFLNPAVGICVPANKTIKLTFAIGIFSQWDKDTGRDAFLTFKFGLLIL